VKTTASQAFANGEFFVESTGLSDNTYHLKFVTLPYPAFISPANSLTSRLTADTAHSLQLAGASGGDLYFAPIAWSGTFVCSFYPGFRLLTSKSYRCRSQNFAIDCSSCSTSADVGLNCVIAHPATSTCVTSNTGSFTLALAPCDGTFGQQFNFHA
jgi:hypothetical protein